jgi:hypothetical protein
MFRMALYILITKEYLVLLIVVRLWGGGRIFLVNKNLAKGAENAMKS